MKTIIEWPLPRTNNVGFYLQDLTPENHGKIYYAKYGVDLIGELDVRNYKVREWAVPWRRRGSGVSPGGITYGPDGNPWFRTSVPQTIVRLDPNTGLFTAYFLFADFFAGGGCLRQLMFDAKGKIWFTGLRGGRAFLDDSLPVVGWLNPKTQGYKYWLLPPQLILDPEDLWVDSLGDVWITHINSNMNATGAAFARLHPATDELTCWIIAEGYEPSYPSIVADAKVENVWITKGRKSGRDDPSVFRLNVPSNTCLGYRNPPLGMAAGGISLDSTGRVWFPDSSRRKICTVSKDAVCEEEIKIDLVIERLEPISVERARTYERRADAIVTPTKPWEAEVEVTEGCYTDFSCPIGPTNPNGAIAITPGKQDKIFFAEFGLENRIGCLQP
jgi:streptogramin lyase